MYITLAVLSATTATSVLIQALTQGPSATIAASLGKVLRTGTYRSLIITTP